MRRIRALAWSVLILWPSVIKADRKDPRNSVIVIRNQTTGTKPLCSGVIIGGNFGLTLASCFPERKYDRPYNASDLDVTLLNPYYDESTLYKEEIMSVGLLHGHSEFHHLGLSQHWMSNVVLLMLLARDAYRGAVDPYIQSYGDYLKAESLTILNSERCHVVGVNFNEESIFYEPAIVVDDVCDQYCKENKHLCSSNGYYVRLLEHPPVRLMPGAAFLCQNKVVSVIDTNVTCDLDIYVGELTAPLAMYKMLRANLVIEDSENGYVTIRVENDFNEWDYPHTHSSSQVISKEVVYFILIILLFSHRC